MWGRDPARWEAALGKGPSLLEGACLRQLGLGPMQGMSKMSMFGLGIPSLVTSGCGGDKFGCLGLAHQPPTCKDQGVPARRGRANLGPGHTQVLGMVP